MCRRFCEQTFRKTQLETFDGNPQSWIGIDSLMNEQRSYARLLLPSPKYYDWPKAGNIVSPRHHAEMCSSLPYATWIVDLFITRVGL